MGKVQRKDIRPCPPLVEISGSCVPGEIVEVFENSSWKAAKIVDVLGSGNYSVLVLGGSSDKLEVEKSNVRIPQSWNGDRWVLVNKESEKLNERKTEIPWERGSVDNQRLQQYAEVRRFKKCGKRDDEPYRISVRGLKKRLDNKAGAGRKMGAARKVRKRRSLFPKMGQNWRPAKLASVGPRCWQQKLVNVGATPTSAEQQAASPEKKTRTFGG
ncbi:uncharacterized protein LOC109843183 isoform X3 [Asparagus officinalis]|uniref:uncharacterized protein LOC109843183 isoform X3 n=1 Tax=Asparagus officinalis TaxID=4686 RepID=UPI00098DF285|nr:uncharacterized protein LOC109843183 isoform X3 [Asparagus officinalis]